MLVSYDFFFLSIGINFKIFIRFFFAADQRDQSYEMESLPPNQSGRGHLKRKPRTTSVRVPSVNVISEVSDGMVRSQSVGHSIDNETTTHFYDSNKLLSVNYNGNGRQENGKTVPTNGKTDGMRYTLSQPLLIHPTSEHENKPLKESHKHWRSGTLSRPDVFYQVTQRVCH